MMAGKLKHRVVFQRKSETVDETGAISTEWVDEYNCWASILPISGKENFSSNHFGSETDSKIMIRWTKYASNITPKYRIKSGCDIYNITAIIPDATGRINIRFACSKSFDKRYDN